MAIFQQLANVGLIASSAQSICMNLRNNLSAAENFYDWLIGVEDSDLLALNMSQSDITMMRNAFNDLHALSMLCYGQAVPAENVMSGGQLVPAPYNITGTYNFAQYVALVVGGQ